jgi:hypothetical protein
MKKLFVVILAALLVTAFTAPAMAKFNINAVIQTDFYWWEQSAENKVGGTGVATGTVPGDNDLSTINIDVPGWSRFNITWTNEKDVRARFEVQSGGVTTAAAPSPGVTMRHAYGAWQATPNFELMAGWSTTPFSPLAPPQSLGTNGGTHIILLGFGEFYSGRFPQVRGTWKFSDNVRLAVALVDPVIAASPFVASPTPSAPVTGVSVSDNESEIPRIDVGLPCYFGPLKLYPSFFWHEQQYDNIAAGQENDWTAWGLSLGARMSFGPVTVTGEFNMGENWALTQGTALNLYGFAPYLLANGTISDTEHVAYWIDVAMKMGPVTPHFLYGSFDSENEGVLGASDDQDRKTNAYVLGVTIPVAKTFMINPEIGYYDFDDDASLGGGGANLPTDYGTHTLIGLRFTVVF